MQPKAAVQNNWDWRLMKNPYNNLISNFGNQGAALLAGVILPVCLILTIPLFFKSELKQVEEKSPIVIEMMAFQMPKKLVKPVKKIKPAPKVKKIVKKPTPRPIPKKAPKKIIKKTMLAKAKPVKKEIVEPQKLPPVKKVQKIVKLPKEIVPEIISLPTMPVPVPIFKLTEAPQFLHRENLVYPESMRSSGITGIVKLAVLIGKEGNVYRVKILKSAGDDFDEAAKIALRASTFIPAKVGNKNVAVELRMPVKFRLL